MWRRIYLHVFHYQHSTIPLKVEPFTSDFWIRRQNRDWWTTKIGPHSARKSFFVFFKIGFAQSHFAFWQRSPFPWTPLLNPWLLTINERTRTKSSFQLRSRPESLFLWKLFAIWRWLPVQKRLAATSKSLSAIKTWRKKGSPQLLWTKLHFLLRGASHLIIRILIQLSSFPLQKLLLFVTNPSYQRASFLLFFGPTTMGLLNYNPLLQ